MEYYTVSSDIWQSFFVIFKRFFASFFKYIRPFVGLDKKVRRFYHGLNQIAAKAAVRHSFNFLPEIVRFAQTEHPRRGERQNIRLYIYRFG